MESLKKTLARTRLTKRSDGIQAANDSRESLEQFVLAAGSRLKNERTTEINAPALAVLTYIALEGFGDPVYAQAIFTHVNGL